MLKALASLSLTVAIGIFPSSGWASCAGGSNTISSTIAVFNVPLNDYCVDVVIGGSISYSGNSDALYNNKSNVTINNAGSILASGYLPYGIENSGSITTLNNTGLIRSTDPNGQAVGFVNNSGATVSNFINAGVIESQGPTSIVIQNFGTIQTLTNTGSISATGTGSWGGVFNFAGAQSLIVNLNNAQGGVGLSPSTTALTYYGGLPTNYNIIINSSTHYGQLSGSTFWGSTNFGVYAGSTITTKLYTSVLNGLTTSNVGASRSGTYNGLNWTLALQSGSSTIWDLIFTGGSTLDTQSSLNALASKLRSGFSSQAIATNFANMNTYDCDLFDAKGVCVSVGGQQTYVDNPSSNMTSTVVVAGYKVSPNIRIGGFLNQNINNNTVASVHISNANPLMGLFAVWNKNEDRLGYQVKIANAYQDKDVTTTRDVVGTSEAGTGSTNLNTQSYVGELSYAFLANEDKTLVRPYAAIRYTRIKQDGYSEQTTSNVTAPLTFASLEDRSTAALVGVKLNHKLTDKVNLTGSIGVEQDLYHHVDNLTATGVSGLTSENFNNNINRTRPVASIGAYFMPVKNQRIAADLYYQQLPFQSTGSTTAYVNYMIGF